MIKAIFFDNDGVLVSTEHLVHEANAKACTELGIEYSQTDFERFTFHTNLGSTGFLKEKGFTDTQIKEFKNLRNHYWQQNLGTFDHSISGAEEVLDWLKKEEISIIITTSAHRKIFEKTHQHTGFRNLFSQVLTQEDYDKIKPAPDIYLKALEITNLTPAECLIVEDTPRGVAAANAAGIQVVAIPHDMTRSLNFDNADYQLDSISKLTDLIKKLNETS